ncbi:hypothetical protein EV129_10953 [Rhizobium azibense]|uniref:Uncharacterized protein n=1 Tax=Rhizobium azibense TaxID=1136135 RepID=A0A4R3RID6_9HYPH|nr:hypothetical protein EV129_10953 [Rhizobium azibense]
MFWDELMLWFDEARQIHAESFGLVNIMLGGAKNG